MAKSAGVEELIFEALERSLADPRPRKLHGTRTNPGIFLTRSAAAVEAARRCLEQGLIAPRGEERTKSKATPLYGLGAAGIRYLLEHDPLRQLLAATQEGVARLGQASADCQQTLAKVQQQAAQLQEVVQQAAQRLQPPDLEKMLAAATTPGDAAAARGAAPAVDARKARETAAVAGGPGVESGLARAAKPTGAESQLGEAVLQHLRQHKRQTPLRPLDLPQLFRFARSRQPALSLGAFHDLVRDLADAGQIRLSPFTQAMYQLAEPECAMIVGREIMYYAECV